jgi:hypothetical protein
MFGDISCEDKLVAHTAPLQLWYVTNTELFIRRIGHLKAPSTS